MICSWKGNRKRKLLKGKTRENNPKVELKQEKIATNGGRRITAGLQLTGSFLAGLMHY